MTGKKISTDETRKIIVDFAREISKKKRPGAKPEKTVIEFRNDHRDGIEREIFNVPTKILRFRKDNGRIASDVMSFEIINGRLDETLEETQEILRKFLKEKDEEKNITLRKSILHSGQNEPAIITCDGFLINGNRRKMVIEELFNDPKTSDKNNFETMKVVILPGYDDKGDGGPPTIKEIEQIENRYQLQSDGKAEYTNFDRAITIQRKIRKGMTLDEQLWDNPSYIGMSEKEFKKEKQKCQDEFLGPLECVDNYLEQLDRKGLYDNISEGRTDREGRWYSFIDYYKSIYKPLQDEKTRINVFGIEEDEVGEIEDIAFKIIRKKDFPHIKTHEVIRKLSKILKDKHAKKEIMKIINVPHKLDKNDFNENDDFKTIDKKWGKKHETAIVGKVIESIRIMEHTKELETPLVLLNDALKKLNHENMNPDSMSVFNFGDAWEKCKEIQVRAYELEKIFWEKKESLKKLKNKKW
jgi:hypothetical protein